MHYGFLHSESSIEFDTGLSILKEAEIYDSV